MKVQSQDVSYETRRPVTRMYREPAVRDVCDYARPLQPRHREATVAMKPCDPSCLFRRFAMMRNLYGEVAKLGDIREINRNIRREMSEAATPDEITELKRRSDYLCTLT